MIKECKVTLNNELVTVIDFDGTLVQIPSIRSNKATVMVSYEDGKYIVLPDDMTQKNTKKRKKQRK